VDRAGTRFKLFREAEGRTRSRTRDEFARLLKELPEHLADANVKGLEWQYVDLELEHAWVPGSQHKNGSPHTVPLNEMALSILREQLGRSAAETLYRWIGVGCTSPRNDKAQLVRLG